jgi:predicted phosphodiesterase
MHPSDISPQRIGIIADSHSDLDITRLAIEELRSRQVDAIVHLGDICDSLQAELLDASVSLLVDNRLVAVKGNNDHLLEALLVENDPDRFHPQTRSFLKQLPMKIEWDGVCFAHSLPFDFLRSFYEPIDTGTVDRAHQLFILTPYRIIFAGHSHRPALFRWQRGEVVREELDGIPSLTLHPEERYIIIVGAVTRGECGLFDRKRLLYERIQFSSEGQSNSGGRR